NLMGVSSPEHHRSIENAGTQSMPGEQFYVPPSPPLSPVPESSGYLPPRGYQQGTIPRPVVNQDRRDSRFASVITILILLATLLLLGFSIYLAADLGFIKLPFINNPTPTATTIGTVPRLLGLNY